MTESTEIIIKLPELPVIEVVDDLIQVYKECMVIRAALKLKFFDWMAENGPASKEDISAGTGISDEYIASLLGMLYYLDMVRRSDERYLLSPSANLHFVSTSQYYQGDIILALSEPGSPWEKIDEYITNPGSHSSFLPANRYAEASVAEMEIRGTVKNISTVISRWTGFKNAKTLYEYGSGHGLYAIATCQLNPDLIAFVYQPPGCSLLQDNITKYGMTDRVIPCGDEIQSTDLKKYDIILASHSLYQNQEKLSDRIHDIASQLEINGLFVSNHWFSRDTEGTGMQGLYELELALHNRFHLIKDRSGFEELCRKNNLALFQTGMMRTAYGEATIHMATRVVEE